MACWIRSAECGPILFHPRQASLAALPRLAAAILRGRLVVVLFGAGPFHLSFFAGIGAVARGALLLAAAIGSREGNDVGTALAPGRALARPSGRPVGRQVGCADPIDPGRRRRVSMQPACLVEHTPGARCRQPVAAHAISCLVTGLVGVVRSFARVAAIRARFPRSPAPPLPRQSPSTRRTPCHARSPGHRWRRYWLPEPRSAARHR